MQTPTFVACLKASCFETTCLIAIVLFASNACTENTRDSMVFPKTVCNTENPVQDLQWLSTLISDAKHDPNFIETVWINRHGQQDIIVIKYVVSSVAYFCYDCQGGPVEITDLAFFNSLKDDHKVYSHLNN